MVVYYSPSTTFKNRKTENNAQTGNHIESEGAIKLSESLMVNNSITKLFLAGDEKKKKKIKVVDKTKWWYLLQETELDTKEQLNWVNHWKLILHWLRLIWSVVLLRKKKEGKLKKWHFTIDNEIGTEGVIKICQSLKINSTLFFLDLCGND